MTDQDFCPKCGLRSCRVALLQRQLDKTTAWKDRTSLTAEDRDRARRREKLEKEMTVAQDNCDAFSRARKKPS